MRCIGQFFPPPFPNLILVLNVFFFFFNITLLFLYIFLRFSSLFISIDVFTDLYSLRRSSLSIQLNNWSRPIVNSSSFPFSGIDYRITIITMKTCPATRCIVATDVLRDYQALGIHDI